MRVYISQYPTGTDGVLLVIHENGTVDLTALANWFGEANITVTASDGHNATAECSFFLSVLPVNDPPVLEHIKKVVINEGKTLVLRPNASDVDSSFLKFTYSGDMTDDTWITGYSDAGIYTVNVSVSDGEISVSQEISIVINNINRAPVALGGRDRTVRAGETLYFDASRSYDPDIDNDTNGGDLTYRWEFGDDEAGEGKAVSHRYKKPGKHVVMLRVTDDNNATDTYNLTITVEGIKESTSVYIYFGAAGLVVLLIFAFIIVKRISVAKRERDMLS